MKSDVSVVITCYNYGAYVRGAIESALAQTLPPKEIVVINDGSTDASARALDGYRGHGIVRVIHQDNAGQAAAKNRGVRESTGPFIAFLDADDAWHPRKLEKQRPLFDDDRVGVVYARQTFVDPVGEPLSPQPGRLAAHRGSVLRPFLFDNFVPFSSSIVRRLSFERAGGFDERLPMSIDWDLWLRIAVRDEFDFVDEDLLFYRRDHPGQMSGNTAGRQTCCDLIMKRFVDVNRDRLDPRDLREAEVYTCNVRGYALERNRPREAARYYLRSLARRPFQLGALRGVAKTALYGLRRIAPAGGTR